MTYATAPCKEFYNGSNTLHLYTLSVNSNTISVLLKKHSGRKLQVKNMEHKKNY